MGKKNPKSCLVTLWRYLRRGARTIDREWGPCQETQHDEHVSEPMAEIRDQKGGRSQHMQQELPQSAPQEQDKAGTNTVESQEVSSKVRLKDLV